jgi:hypothetical protein
MRFFAAGLPFFSRPLAPRAARFLPAVFRGRARLVVAADFFARFLRGPAGFFIAPAFWSIILDAIVPPDAAGSSP